MKANAKAQFAVLMKIGSFHIESVQSTGNNYVICIPILIPSFQSGKKQDAYSVAREAAQDLNKRFPKVNSI